MATQQTEDIAQANGGLVTAARVVEAGILRARLSDMVKFGELERVRRGVYCLADAWEDEFLSAQLRFPKGVFSDGTALFLHVFTDRTPFSLTMTSPRSYRVMKACACKKGKAFPSCSSTPRQLTSRRMFEATWRCCCEDQDAMQLKAHIRNKAKDDGMLTHWPAYARRCSYVDDLTLQKTCGTVTDIMT